MLSALTDAELDTGVAAAAALKNKIEFDKRINDWRTKGNQQSGSSNLATTSESYLQSKVETASTRYASQSSLKSVSTKSSRSSRSSKSTALSVKRLNA